MYIPTHIFFEQSHFCSLSTRSQNIHTFTCAPMARRPRPELARSRPAGPAPLPRFPPFAPSAATTGPTCGSPLSNFATHSLTHSLRSHHFHKKSYISCDQMCWRELIIFCSRLTPRRSRALMLGLHYKIELHALHSIHTNDIYY